MRQAVRIFLGFACIAAYGAALYGVWPAAREAGQILAAQDDPAALSDLQLARVVRRDPGLVEREIEQALKDRDPDLAQSFVDLAAAQNIPLSEATVSRVTDAVAQSQSALHLTSRFATGFLTGDTDDVASFSGTVAGDLFAFGDLRDVVIQGKNLIAGEEPDRLVLGLAAVGLAVTAGTYASVGTASPVRAGLSVFKGARKSARLSAGLSDWARRSTHEMIDVPLLQKAVATASVVRPAKTLDAFKAAVRTDKAALLVTAIKDVGRVGEKAGVRGALDIMKVADNPKDLARAARLADAKGGQTRAILKVLGRGALMLAAGAFHLASWLFGALMLLIGLVASIKSTTERLTLAWLRRAKVRRLRKTFALQSAVAPVASV